jgi:hypothetical protein
VPRTRHPLDYPITRLYLQIGLAAGSWLPLLPPVPKPERAATERRLARLLGIEQGIESGLITGYSFQWGRHGQLQELRLVPARRLRDTPGIRPLKKFLFGRLV